MTLREYMKKHQQVDVFKEFHHFITMASLFPIYIVDYNLNKEYYGTTADNSDFKTASPKLKHY